MSIQDLEILYKRQCEYSDYLDDLQRSSQRYYFLTLGGYVGLLLTVFTTLYKEDQCLALPVVLSIAKYATIPIIAFGVFTVLQLASLRALNLKIDRRIKFLEREISYDTSARNFFPLSDRDERTELFTLGNDWIKASFVTLGNTVCVLFYLKDVQTNWLVLISLLIFFVHLVCYAFLAVYRLGKESLQQNKTNHAQKGE
jgi:hypothetical protein